MLHVHDYDMEFLRAGSLDFVMRCRCGDQCSDMDEALRRMSASRARAMVTCLVAIGLVVAIVAVAASTLLISTHGGQP